MSYYTFLKIPLSRAAETQTQLSRRSAGGWVVLFVAHPEVLVGKPVIKGTRISVELVMDLLAGGYTTDQIIHQHDHLSREDIQACLAYARDIVHSERDRIRVQPLSPSPS